MKTVRLSIFDSLVDDTAFSSIGEFMPFLVELNAGKNILYIFWRKWVLNEFSCSLHRAKSMVVYGYQVLLDN